MGGRMWTKATPAIDMLNFEIEAYRQQGVADPFAACSGLVWWRDFLQQAPAATAEDLRLRYEQELTVSERPNHWARGLLTNQGHLLYQEFRQTMIGALPDGELAHMVCDDYPFTEAEKQTFKRRIAGRFQRHPNYSRIAVIVDG